MVKKNKNDKSAFLVWLGYTLEYQSDLLNDIKNIVATNEAYLQQ